VRDQLERAGLEAVNIASVGPCTRCASDRFFSRRAAGGKTTGLQMSFVGFAA
jgi:copper oxidase (laccase) domain-containing protein